VAEPSAGQPPLVTVTPSCTVPLGPAVKVIERPVEEPTMVPFPIRQLYVAPGPASGTEAARPVPFWQARGGAVIVAFGIGFTVTTAEPDEVPPHVVASVRAVTE
jgi:hypothetical protein